MPAPIRVVLADDSAAVRRLVTDVLHKQPDIQVAGAAKHGREALSLIATHKPDIILLDVEMPVMDGIDTLREIRQKDRRTPVVMFSSLTVRGGEATLDALALGASDYVPKPTGKDTVDQAMAYVERELVPRIMHLVRRNRPAIQIVTPKGKPTPARPAASTPTPATPAGRPSVVKAAPVVPKFGNASVDIVAIGSSTGGPNALATLVAQLPADFPVPIVVVQHMPAMFTALLAERLDRACALTVTEAADGVPVRAGHILVAPGDYHMTVKSAGTSQLVELNQDTPENSCRPAVDVLFRSVAATYGRRSLGVVLTGMGYDGTEGARVMRDKGSAILAQDEASSVVWGMPRSVAEAGLADEILPLDQVAGEMVKRVQTKRRSTASTLH